MSGYTNVVAIKHFGDSTVYLFQLPLCENVKKGELVTVGTRQGVEPVTCACDSVWVDERATGLLLALNRGAALPLKRLTGRFAPMKYEEVGSDEPHALEEISES